MPLIPTVTPHCSHTMNAAKYSSHKILYNIRKEIEKEIIAKSGSTSLERSITRGT
jgi:hypothetical protein